ncbi:MAG: 16S rRNA (cytosine(1402)-N(4))-methyltransferase RsmH [Oscillospiraceae bacterium]|jgi:16S rRNA (cytosine1402-N4)-methyltransferase
MTCGTGEYHIPVLAHEAVEGLAVVPGGTYLDGTMGGGGHSSLIAEKLEGTGRLFCIDRDPDAVELGKHRFSGQGNITVIRGNFADAPQLLEGLADGVDGALLDLGVSSHQLDDPDRGFSYLKDGALDMRMSKDGLTAADIVNTWSEEDLASVIRRYGEEPYDAAVARKICRAREEKPIYTTGELSEIVISAMPPAVRRKSGNPARKTFQALRIAVNDELGALEKGLSGIFSILNPKGRFCVITFQSLEDRIVKNFFKEMCEGDRSSAEYLIYGRESGARARAVTRKPVLPGKEETDSNRRARSAKLRIIEKVG